MFKDKKPVILNFNKRENHKVCVYIIYVTLDQKKTVIRVFFYIYWDLYIIWKLKLSIDVGFDLLWQDNIWLRYNYLENWNLRVLSNAYIKMTFWYIYGIYKTSSWNMIFT